MSKRVAQRSLLMQNRLLHRLRRLRRNSHEPETDSNRNCRQWWPYGAHAA